MQVTEKKRGARLFLVGEQENMLKALSGIPDGFYICLRNLRSRAHSGKLVSFSKKEFNSVSETEKKVKISSP
jgi:hypothetical protein